MKFFFILILFVEEGCWCLKLRVFHSLLSSLNTHFKVFVPCIKFLHNCLGYYKTFFKLVGRDLIKVWKYISIWQRFSFYLWTCRSIWKETFSCFVICLIKSLPQFPILLSFLNLLLIPNLLRNVVVLVLIQIQQSPLNLILYQPRMMLSQSIAARWFMLSCTQLGNFNSPGWGWHWLLSGLRNVSVCFVVE